ncbi:MAG: hypothetical protein ACYCZS_00525 [Thiobacillus sp.]
MRTRLHRFLLLLLMLALPVQTFASASMLGCAFSHQAAGEQRAMADELMAGCHESEQPDASPAQHDCTHCAVCALASALPIPATDTLTVMPVRQSYTSHPAASFSGFVPEGPERPPRPSLA